MQILIFFSGFPFFTWYHLMEDPTFLCQNYPSDWDGSSGATYEAKTPIMILTDPYERCTMTMACERMTDGRQDQVRIKYDFGNWVTEYNLYCPGDQFMSKEKLGRISNIIGALLLFSAMVLSDFWGRLTLLKICSV
jgi:hypothetical protein